MENWELVCLKSEKKSVWLIKTNIFIVLLIFTEEEDYAFGSYMPSVAGSTGGSRPGSRRSVRYIYRLTE